MARFRIAAVVRALTSDPAPRPDIVHFHRGPLGRPVVCEHPACSRPHLDVR